MPNLLPHKSRHGWCPNLSPLAILPDTLWWLLWRGHAIFKRQMLLAGQVNVDCGLEDGVDMEISRTLRIQSNSH